MHAFLFNYESHLYILGCITLLAFVSYISMQAVAIFNSEQQLIELSKEDIWEKIPVKVAKRGYNIHYPYLNRYSKEYPDNMSQEAIRKASSYEFEHFKKRVKLAEEETSRGGVTIFYMDESGIKHDRISISNSPDYNFETLKASDKQQHAFRLKSDHSVVVFAKPTKREAKLSVRNKFKAITKTATVMGLISISIFVACLFV